MHCRKQSCSLVVAGGILSVAALGCDYNESQNLQTASDVNFDRGSANHWHRQVNKVDHDEDGRPDDRTVLAFDTESRFDDNPDILVYGTDEPQRRDTTVRESNRSQSQAQAVIANWPQTPQRAAREMIEKYGQPDVVSPTMLVWHNNSPWVRTVVFRETIKHDFPMPHEDCLEQFINYRVPVDKFDDLARYDGSVMCERTAGWLSARCDKEAANFLALNLAHDIITGEKTVEEARQEYARTITAFMNGERPAIMQQLQFDVKAGPSGDPDQPMRSNQNQQGIRETDRDRDRHR